ncbi:MAG: RNA polymerase factor sigma-54, partial [Oscillospiraceae bacterium]
MEHGFGTQQRQEQTQILSPRMMQSLAVLQMPSAELYEYLIKEIEDNPVITFDSIDFAENSRRNTHYRHDYGKENNMNERISDDNNSPITSLRIQFSMLRPKPEIERLGYGLINMLDQNGYLNREDLDRFARTAKVSQKKLDFALGLLQRLEPAGVGARDPQECILLQLERLGLKGGDGWTVASEYLELLGRNQLPQIAKKSGIPLHRVVNAQTLIRSLNPKPLMQEGSDSENDYITPDIRIFKKEGGFAVELNQIKSDSIIIDDTYSKIFRETDSDVVRSFLDDNMKKANWLRDSIRQRCETLMACATQLLSSQGAFFEEGTEALRPYSRKEMAEQIGRSESTISRALKDKYVECDWGMFETDFFFPKTTIDARPMMTRTTIENSIQSIVLGENPQCPMSDETIVTILASMGIEVSRRTVAKYRCE